MDDYSSWDPPIWLGVFALYILPICINFYKCKKNKRKLIPSFLISVFYPTAIWAIIILWFASILLALQIFKSITLIPEWLGVCIAFACSGVLFWPLGHAWQLVWYFYENFKHKGIYSFANIQHKNK